MNYDISKWLKDELGLSHMSEADLNCLMFHPRYGSLCRRFVNFLAESTLCSTKYPNVYAKEEYEAALEEIETKNRDLRTSVKELEEVARQGENDMRELEFLKSRLSHLKTIQQMLRNHSESLETIANRPNFLIELLGRNLDNPEYLRDSSLDSMYTLEEDFKHDAIITNRQMSSIDDRLKESVDEIESSHANIANLAQRIILKMNNLDYNLDMEFIATHDLEALKIPPVEEEIEYLNQDERVLRDKNSKLTKRVSDLDQQVAELGDQYRRRKAEIRAAKSRQLEECLQVLSESGIPRLFKNGSTSLDDPHSKTTINGGIDV